MVDEAIAALCAEAVGVHAALHELTLEYPKQRKQFGLPIGCSRCCSTAPSTCSIALEQARTMTLRHHDGRRAERRRARKAMSAAKVQIGRSAEFVGQNAIQLHGGMGMTRSTRPATTSSALTMIDMAFGDADHHLRELARAGGSADSAASTRGAPAGICSQHARRVVFHF